MFMASEPDVAGMEISLLLLVLFEAKDGPRRDSRYRTI
jgi:hypothetical protein